MSFFFSQSKVERTAPYSTQPVRPVHDRLGVRHPNKTLNKTAVETSPEDKNEKVTIALVMFPVPSLSETIQKSINELFIGKSVCDVTSFKPL